MIFLGWCFVIVSLEILVPCIFGSIVTEKSRIIPINLYGSNWPDQKRGFHSTMRILMERATEPIVLETYKGAFKIALPTFVAVTKSL